MDRDDVLPGLQTREGTNINHTRRINKAREAGKAQMTLPCLGILVEHP